MFFFWIYFGDLRGIHETKRTSPGKNLNFHFVRSFGPFVLCWFCRLDCGELSAEILFDRILVSSPCGDGLHSWDMELREDVSCSRGVTMVQSCSSHDNGLCFCWTCLHFKLWMWVFVVHVWGHVIWNFIQSYTSYERLFTLFTQAVFQKLVQAFSSQNWLVDGCWLSWPFSILPGLVWRLTHLGAWHSGLRYFWCLCSIFRPW